MEFSFSNFSQIISFLQVDALREKVLASSAKERLKCASLQKFGERAFKAWYFTLSLNLCNDVDDYGSDDKNVHLCGTLRDAFTRIFSVV